MASPRLVWMPVVDCRSVRYHRVWEHTAGQTPLYVWRAVSPSPRFVALGMLATNGQFLVSRGGRKSA
eukprot:365907-Chlamydomonas_euryale.AAC.2